MKTRLFRFSTTVKDNVVCPSPKQFVDWYEGETFEQAKADYDEDLHRYGLDSADKCSFTVEERDIDTQKLVPFNWVLRETCGLFIGIGKRAQTVLTDLEHAQKYVGNEDNQQLKQDFFTATTGGTFHVEIL